MGGDIQPIRHTPLGIHGNKFNYTSTLSYFYTPCTDFFSKIFLCEICVKYLVSVTLSACVANFGNFRFYYPVTEACMCE
jgi:hypothetical protein